MTGRTYPRLNLPSHPYRRSSRRKHHIPVLPLNRQGHIYPHLMPVLLDHHKQRSHGLSVRSDVFEILHSRFFTVSKTSTHVYLNHNIIIIGKQYLFSDFPVFYFKIPVKRLPFNLKACNTFLCIFHFTVTAVKTAKYMCGQKILFPDSCFLIIFLNNLRHTNTNQPVTIP